MLSISITTVSRSLHRQWHGFGPVADGSEQLFLAAGGGEFSGRSRASHDYELGWNAINELIRSDGTWSGYERNVFYANNRDGTFSDVSAVAGLDFIEDGRAFALADFDHDGRLEIFLKNRNGPQLRVLKNVVEDLPPSIAFRLQGTKSNRDAIGATVTIESSAGKQMRMLQAGSGFLSQHSKDVFFGLGEAKGSVRASIRWPSGLVQQLQNLPVDHRIWVEEGAEACPYRAVQTSGGRGMSALPMFARKASSFRPRSKPGFWSRFPRPNSRCPTSGDECKGFPRSAARRYC